VRVTASQRADLALYDAAGAMAVATFIIVARLHVDALPRFVSGAQGVLEGRPEWRAYQNRLLSPYLINAMTLLGLSFTRALVLFHLLCLLAEAVLITALLRRFGLARTQTLLYLAALLFGFLVLQDDNLLYTWDGPDLIVFTLLAYAALTGERRLIPLLALFAIELLNRESALFIAAYIALLGVALKPGGRGVVIADWRLVALGGGLMAGGALYTKLVRDLLFIHGSVSGEDAGHLVLGNHLVLDTNLTWPSSLVLIGLAVALASMWNAARPLDDRRLRYLALFTLIAAGGAVFGLALETRTLFVLIPFFVFMPLLVRPQATSTVQL
jgi:hypothetical protein